MDGLDYHRFFTQSLEMLFIAGFDGAFKEVNPAWEGVLGFSVHELMARRIFDIVIAEDRPRTRDAFASLRESETAICLETRCQTRNGELRWLAWTVNSFADSASVYGVARDITDQKKAHQRLERNHSLLRTLGRIQNQYIQELDAHLLFDHLLESVLSLTESEYGFIGEILKKEDGTPYLKTHAITNIAWDEATRAFYRDNAPAGLEFFNLDTLFGAVIRSGEALIANDPVHHPQSGGIPPGHPPLKAFMGAPFFVGGRFIGMVGIANRAGGYDADLLADLQPLLKTCGHLIIAFKNDLKRRCAEAEVRERNARLLAIMDHAPYGILTMDEHGILESCNPTVLQLFGYLAEELCGASISLLIPDLARDEPSEATHDALKEPSLDMLVGHTLELNGRHSEGEMFPLELGVSEMWLGGRRMYTVMLRDITERRKMENIKDELISVVSHELRTPLTSIQGAIKMLRVRGLEALVGARADTLIDLAERNCARLSELISDMLDIDTIEREKEAFRLTSLDLQPIVEEAVRLVAPLAEQRDIGVRFDEVPSSLDAWCAASRLIQVLTNLLSNAIKYSPNGATVNVRGRRIGEKVRLEVIDRGEGIPIAFREHVFQKFSQAERSSVRRRGGTGLGLSICKAIMERQNGDIGFVSEERRGTTFWIELAAAAADD